jgi:SAM-dependent methyltransferase
MSPLLAPLFKTVRATTRLFGIELSRYKQNVSDTETLYVPTEWSDTVSSWCGGFGGKRIREVGCDVTGKFVQQIARLYGPDQVVGINPRVKSQEFSPNCRIEAGDIRSSHYRNDYFDVILSSSAFEHIQNFDVALAEMYRILKPGGYLFSHFGPIWSASYGHHLWLTHNDELYNYWNVVLPPHCHVLLTHEQSAGLLSGR